MKCHRYTLISGVYRVLPLLHTELLTHCLTHDPTNMKECPIQLGPLLYLHIQTPQVINVHKTDTMTTQLHEGLLLGNRHLCLWHGHRTLTGGRIKPKNPKPMLCPVTYYSNTFMLTERNYDIYEQEFLGVLKALKHFRPHVAAMEIPATILMDHANLTHWKAMRKVNRQVVRWFAEIQDYNLTIKHIPGKIHTTPDMLSRPPGADQGKQDNVDIVLLPPSLFITTARAQDDMLKTKVKEVQSKQREEMEFWCNTQGVRKLPEGYTKEWKLAVPSGLVLR